MGPYERASRHTPASPETGTPDGRTETGKILRARHRQGRSNCPPDPAHRCQRSRDRAGDRRAVPAAEVAPARLTPTACPRARNATRPPKVSASAWASFPMKLRLYLDL